MVSMNVFEEGQPTLFVARGIGAAGPLAHYAASGSCRCRFASCRSSAGGRLPALRHFSHRRRPARSCTQVVGTRGSEARSTVRGVRHREQAISSQGCLPLIAWTTRRRVIDRLAIGPHALVPAMTQQVIRLADHRLPATRVGRAPREDRMSLRERVSALASALRWLPETGVGLEADR